MERTKLPLLLISLLSIFSLHKITLSPFPVVAALPLSTDSRWIIDESGRRVKLACVNWAAHLETVVAEGLSKQPVNVITKQIADMGYNCVRLTWPLYLATNGTLAAVTVRESFLRVGLVETVAGLQANNPSIVDLPLISAFQAVVESLGGNKVMVILDNHISKPGWCCSNYDGNGFFGDPYLDPDLWIQGLSKMASLFKSTPYVVGMSLRNELRGPRQDVTLWYRYMQRGAEAVHLANPNVLVILSGLSFDKDLSFLRNRPLSLSFTGKLVFEVHWYAFSNGQDWKEGNPNRVCGSVMGNIKSMSGYLVEQGYPMFVSEFGVDLRGNNVNDNRYLNCFMGWVADMDMDWALWTLVGSYYLREGVVGMEEYYGVLSWNWGDVRNSSFLDRISLIQSPLQGPGLSDSNPHKIIFHPSTGLCVLTKSLLEPLRLGPCSQSEAWTYTPQKTLTLKGTYFCLQATRLDRPIKMGLACSSSGSIWEPISDSKMHLAASLGSNNTVCLDVDSDNNIFTTMCKCLSNDSTCDPGSQWFKIINSTITHSTSISSLVQASSILAFPLNGWLGNWT